MSRAPVSEMGFKVPGFRQAPEIYPCPGGCGVMTRSNGQPASKFPGTRCRGVGGMCYKCGKAAPTVARQQPPKPKPRTDGRDMLVQLMEAQARERRAREREQIEMVIKRRKTVRPAYSNA